MRRLHGKYGVMGVLVLALLLGLLLAAGPAGAGSKTFFTTTLEPIFDDPAWSYGSTWWTNLGMTYHIRDRVLVLWWQSSDPRLTGRSVTNAEVDAHWIPAQQTAVSQERGTATLYVEGVGVWESTYTGETTQATGVHVVKGVGHGVSGSVAGLHFAFTIVDGATGITGSGYIIEK